MNTFLIQVTNRLPGGSVFFDLIHSFADHRYGLRVTVSRVLYQLGVYFFGCRRFHENQSIGELKAPYPILYHFTSAQNVESIMAKGLLPNRGRVWMTDWTNPGWVKRFGKRPLACFWIDTQGLIASGHKVSIRQKCHEFTTDHVPPHCLTEIQTIGGDAFRRRHHLRAYR